MRRTLITTLFCLAALPAAALDCRGTAPDWSVVVSEASAEFVLGAEKTAMDIPDETEALNDPGTRALTLIGGRTTAILVVSTRACNTRSLSAYLLTQDGTTPILLTGCCTP